MDTVNLKKGIGISNFKGFLQLRNLPAVEAKATKLKVVIKRR